MTTLTALERKVLAVLLVSSAGNGHDFGFIEDAREAVDSPRQLGGVIASLVKKEVIRTYDPVNGWTQFTFRDGHEAIPALIAKETP